MLVVMIGFFSSMVLLALLTQKVLHYDAWTSGLVLAPGGVGNMLSLVLAGRLITRVDQRWMLALGCVLNAWAAFEMSTLTLGVDYWALAWPRFVQGVGIGFIFVPLNTVALATIRREQMGNATAALNVVRNLGGGIGVAVMTTLLARAEPAAPCHPGRAHQRLGPRDDRAASRLDRPLRRPGRRQLHGRAARPRRPVPGGDAPGPAPRLRRRLLAALRAVLDGDPPAAAAAAPADRHGGARPRPRRRRSRARGRRLTPVPFPLGSPRARSVPPVPARLLFGSTPGRGAGFPSHPGGSSRILVDPWIRKCPMGRSFRPGQCGGARSVGRPRRCHEAHPRSTRGRPVCVMRCRPAAAREANAQRDLRGSRQAVRPRSAADCRRRVTYRRVRRRVSSTGRSFSAAEPVHASRSAVAGMGAHQKTTVRRAMRFDRRARRRTSCASLRRGRLRRAARVSLAPRSSPAGHPWLPLPWNRYRLI